jgi:hypothetical protein
MAEKSPASSRINTIPAYETIYAPSK